MLFERLLAVITHNFDGHAAGIIRYYILAFLGGQEKQAETGFTDRTVRQFPDRGPAMSANIFDAQRYSPPVGFY